MFSFYGIESHAMQSLGDELFFIWFSSYFTGMFVF